jgi:hypothetical protein
VSLVDGPRAIEAIDGASFVAPGELDAVLARTFVPAHATQRTTGGAMPRLAGVTPSNLAPAATPRRRPSRSWRAPHRVSRRPSPCRSTRPHR